MRISLPSIASKFAPLAAALLMAGALSGCDNGPSAVTSQGSDRAGESRRATNENTAERGGDRGASLSARHGGRDFADDARSEPAALLDGKPEWAASRRYSARENADRAFARNGEAFKARDRKEFIRKAHAFVESPPKGALTLTRSNGDRLIYDPAANIFAVATPDGAPRTMFKPDDGMSYWERQKAQAETRRDRSGGESRDRGA